MVPSSVAKSTEQVLEKLFFKQIQENIERINLLEKKIGVNVLMCENFLKQFPDNSRLNHLFDVEESGSRILCAEFCEGLNTENSLIGGFLNRRIEKSSVDECNDISSSASDSKTAIRSELAQLDSAKRLSDSLTLQLEAEEACLKAEITSLIKYLDSKPTHTDKLVNQQSIEDLGSECDQLKEECLKSIKDLACTDQLETSRVKFDRRKARQAAYLGVLEDKIQEAQLSCSKLEIFHDIMALEKNALLEMSNCAEKIYLALRKYLDVSADVKSRFQNADELLENGFDPCLIDDLLKDFLTSLLIGRLYVGCPSHNIFHFILTGLDQLEVSDNSEMVSNEILLKKFEEKIASLNARNSASFFTLKEFGRLVHDISHLLSKALRWLEHSDSSEERPHNEVSESPCIYWNALASFSGVIPQRLVERLLQVRKELDNASAALRKLELSFELNSGFCKSLSE
ncbi:hypothetical protein Aperf_G00000062351 [Anoplocephala perfoliata]